MARIRALIRRRAGEGSAVLQAGPLEFDTVAREARVGGRALRLTLKETAILEYFMHHPGALLTHTQVKEHVWNYDFESDSKLVEAYISRLRRRLAAEGLANPWTTVRGGGYRFEPRRLSGSTHEAPAPG